MPKRQLQNRQKSGVSHAETTLPERWRFARRNVIFRTCQKDGVSHAKTPPTFLERWRFACRKRIHVIAKNLMISLQAVENQRRQPSAFAKTEVLYCHGLCNCAVHTILQQSTIHYMYVHCTVLAETVSACSNLLSVRHAAIFEKNYALQCYGIFV